MSSYSVYLNTSMGTRLAVLPFTSLQYSLAVNAIGALAIDVSPDFDLSFLVRDAQIEVWRSVDGGAEYLDGDKKWLVRDWSQPLGKNKAISISAVCPNDILRRRIIAYPAGTAFTSKTDSADDLIKAFARENLVTIDGSRDVVGSAGIGSYFSVEPDFGLATSLSIAAARDNLLETCRKICEASTTAGAYLAFDVIWNGVAFELRTFLNQRGIDRRSTLILSTEFGNFADGLYRENYASEVSVVIGGAQGIADARLIRTLSDTERVSASPFGQIEVFAQGNGAGYDSAALDDQVSGALRAGRPVRTVTGRISETPGTRYGREWFWGDWVTVQVGGVNYSARIDAVTVSMSDGRETIDAGVRID